MEEIHDAIVGISYDIQHAWSVKPYSLAMKLYASDLNDREEKIAWRAIAIMTSLQLAPNQDYFQAKAQLLRAEFDALFRDQARAEVMDQMERDDFASEPATPSIL